MSLTVLNRNRRTSGFTLVECVFAMAIAAFLLGALYALNTWCLLILNSGREAAAGARSLQDRIEQLQTCTWAQLTNATYINGSVLDTSTTGLNLGSTTETVTLNAYPTAINPPIKLVRSGAVVNTISSNVAMANQSMVRVDITLSWTGRGNRSRTQSTVAVISKTLP